MTPNKEKAIIDYIRRININHGGATPQMVESRIKALGFDDPGRELRRLVGRGKLVRWETGIYYAKDTKCAQGIGRFL